MGRSFCKDVAEFSKGHTIVVEKSTLPVRTAKTIQKILTNAQKENYGVKNKSFSVLSNPEFSSEGTAIKDLEDPDRVLIGGEDQQAMQSLVDLYKLGTFEKIICTKSLEFRNYLN